MRNGGMIAYFDCFSGISGDMCLGALVDAGAPLEDIERELKKLRVRGYSLAKRKVRRAGFASTKVDVVTEGGGGSGARKWADIRRVAQTSSLPEDMKVKGLKIFKTLFEAEAAVHGLNVGRTHLHELGAVDCLVDVFGALVGLDLLGVKTVRASAVNLGGGSVKTAHGVLPVPAPATAYILKGVPVYQAGESFELTTPTGAAILKTLSEGFGEMPFFTVGKIGAGAGKRDPGERPNILRIFIGKEDREREEGDVSVIETNIDDMNPQIYEYLAGRLLKEGALDVFLTQVIMKKMRPGVKMTVLCPGAKRNDMIGIILEETTSLGVRWHEVSRVTMARESREVRTRYGRVRVKISRFEGIRKATPEYEDCRIIAEKSGVPLGEVIEEARGEAKRHVERKSLRKK